MMLTLDAMNMIAIMLCCQILERCRSRHRCVVRYKLDLLQALPADTSNERIVMTLHTLSGEGVCFVENEPSWKKVEEYLFSFDFVDAVRKSF